METFSLITEILCVWLPPPWQRFLWISKAPAVLLHFLGVVEYQILTTSPNKFSTQCDQPLLLSPQTLLLHFLLYNFDTILIYEKFKDLIHRWGNWSREKRVTCLKWQSHVNSREEPRHPVSECRVLLIPCFHLLEFWSPLPISLQV